MGEDREIELIMEQLRKDLEYQNGEVVKEKTVVTTDDKLWDDKSFTFAYKKKDSTSNDFYICKLNGQDIVYYFKIKKEERAKILIEIDEELFYILSETTIDWNNSIKLKRELFDDDIEEYKQFKINILSSHNKRNYLRSLYISAVQKALNDVMVFSNDDIFIQSTDFNQRRYPRLLVSLNLRFPEVTIKNSQGSSHLIRGLIYHVDFSDEGYSHINGSRYLATGIEISKGYLHSHLYPVTNFFKGSQCYGRTGLDVLTLDKFNKAVIRGEYKVLLSTLREILLFIPSLISWESLEGGPHRLLSSLKYKPSGDRDIDNTCKTDNINCKDFYQIVEELLINFVDKNSFKAIFGLNNGKIFIKQSILNNLLFDLFIKDEENIEKIKRSDYYLKSTTDKKVMIISVIDKLIKNRVEKKAGSGDELAHSFVIVESGDTTGSTREEEFINQDQNFEDGYRIGFDHPIVFKDISYNGCDIIKIKLDKKKKTKKQIESAIFNPIMVNNLSNFILSNLITIKK